HPGQAVLRWTNPRPTMINQCPVAGGSCVGTPAYTVAPFHHHHINADRRQRASRRKTRQSRADDHHIGLACWNTRRIKVVHEACFHSRKISSSSSFVSGQIGSCVNVRNITMGVCNWYTSFVKPAQPS